MDVVGRLRARRSEVEEAIFAQVRGDAFDPSGEMDAEYAAGLRAAVAAAVEYGLDGIARGEEWVGPIPLVAVEQARRAARAGVSLDTVLRRYVVGHTLLGEFVMEEIDRGERDGRALDHRSVWRGVSRAQASVLDRLLEACTAEYRDELERAGRSPEQRLSERVRLLLAGDGDREHAEDNRYARALEGLDRELDYDLDAEHVGVIARGAGVREALRSVAGVLDRRLLSVEHGERTVWAWLGGRRGIEMIALERAMSEDRHAGDVFVVGEPARGLEGWRLTHQQAQAALVVALRRPRRFTRYADVVLLASALKDESLAGALVGIYLEPLEDSRGAGAVLRETLRAYLAAERSVSSAAAALRVTRKTVEGRLRLIEERLGRTLHPCPAELEIALELDAIAARATGPEPDRSASEI
jgi:hypothetical protein